jgi:hypothetical protein
LGVFREQGWSDEAKLDARSDLSWSIAQPAALKDGDDPTPLAVNLGYTIDEPGRNTGTGSRAGTATAQN